MSEDNFDRQSSHSVHGVDTEAPIEHRTQKVVTIKRYGRFGLGKEKTIKFVPMTEEVDPWSANCVDHANIECGKDCWGCKKT